MAETIVNAIADRTDNRLWDIRELAEFLGLSVGTTYHLVSQRRIPVVRISSRCIRFLPSAIAEWVESKAHKEVEQ